MPHHGRRPAPRHLAATAGGILHHHPRRPALRHHADTRPADTPTGDHPPRRQHRQLPRPGRQGPHHAPHPPPARACRMAHQRTICHRSHHARGTPRERPRPSTVAHGSRGDETRVPRRGRPAPQRRTPRHGLQSLRTAPRRTAYHHRGRPRGRTTHHGSLGTPSQHHRDHEEHTRHGRRHRGGGGHLPHPTAATAPPLPRRHRRRPTGAHHEPHLRATRPERHHPSPRHPDVPPRHDHRT